jgi:hypothetical protein
MININAKGLFTTRSLQLGTYYSIDTPGSSYGVAPNVPTSSGSGSGGSGTDHTHPNKTLLDKLKLDSNNRLSILTDLVNPPLMQEDW